MKVIRIEAATMSPLLDVLYGLIVSYNQDGTKKASPETAQHLRKGAAAIKEWSPWLPSLPKAVQSTIQGGSSKVADLVEVGTDIAKAFQEIRADEQYSIKALDVLRAAALYLRNDSQAAFNKLQKMAGTVSPWAAQQFVPELEAQDTKGINKLVKRLVGRDDVFLTLEEAKIVRETQPEVYKEYLRMAAQVNKSWKDALVSYIRGTGKSLVPYTEVLKYLDAAGLVYRLPQGFTGMIDDQGRLFTNKGELIDGVPSAITSPTVEMNPTYGPKAPWVFKALKADDSPPTYFYTSAFKKNQADQKFEMVKGLEKKIPVARKKWFAEIKKFNPTKTGAVAAAVLETLYQTSGRIGTRGNTTSGIGTLQVRHLLPQSNGDLKISYSGKDKVRNRHLLRKSHPEQKWLIPILLSLAEGKEPKEFVFTTSDQKFVGPAQVNRLFKALVGDQNATVHKLRTLRGTNIFNEEMAKVIDALKPKVARLNAKSPAQAERLAMATFAKIAEKVGKTLNHVRRSPEGEKVTGTTAIQSYIDPAPMIQFFRELGLRPPRQLERLMRK